MFSFSIADLNAPPTINWTTMVGSVAYKLRLSSTMMFNLLLRVRPPPDSVVTFNLLFCSSYNLLLHVRPPPYSVITFNMLFCSSDNL
jgi:hypothetical protein